MPATVLSTVIEEIDCSRDLVQDLRFSQGQLKVTSLCKIMTCNHAQF